MTFTVVTLACVMGAVVWWVIRQTINVKPWIADNGVANVNHTGFVTGPNDNRTPSLKIGLGVFMAVVTSLFALFISAYLIRMEVDDWRPLQEPALLWWNTGVLLLGSICLQWAVMSGRRYGSTAARAALLGGGICAVVFVTGQFMSWNQLSSAGYFLRTNPANTFFYVLTALHVLHLLGGLVAWGKTMTRSWSDTSEAQIQLGTELCAVYWHFLLVIWLVLFGLMLST